MPATPAGWFSLCAAQYFETYGAGREDLARIAVKNHHNGTLAPKSMLKREITIEDVLGARVISWPFGLYDCAAQSDGAAAAIITRRDLAKSFRDDFILVQFGSDKTYRYSCARAGKEHVERMKALARDGRGLSAYISRYTRDLYDRT